MADELDVQDVVTKTPAEVETSNRGVVKRWLAELQVADETEKDWREEAKSYYEIYEGGRKKSASFNILWSNTETLLGAVYNSTPEPDVRRRFRDEDPVGKQAATVVERSLSYEIDEYDFDSVMESAALDTLITGRGVVRIKYDPTFTEDPAAQGDPETDDVENARLVSELVKCEHVQWDDFRRGPGKTWVEVPWIAFRHEFTFDMAVEKFGRAVADKLTYEQTTASDSVEDTDVKKVFKISKVWEIWDKDTRRVLFIAPSYKEAPCFKADDPLNLKGFWPLPKCLYAVKNTKTLIPTPPYRLYKEQADELDRVSHRILKTVNAMKVRGMYAGNLPEVMKMIEQAEDNDLVPIENASRIHDMGGLDKMIWIMPIDMLAQVLQQLYLAREQIKQAIYEIMGIGDIMRGVSDPNETKGAQVLKSQWGSMRLQRLQREVQRLVRDVLRIKAEVICERFALPTLQQITNIQMPMAEQKMQAQSVAQQAQQTGQEIPPEVQAILDSPSWEEVMALLRTDALRAYRIDIETDSTIAETIERDTKGLAEVLTAIGGLFEQAFPAVQSGMLSVDAVKQFAMIICRRARMGRSIEDALDDIQPPPPQPKDEEAIMAAKEQLVQAARQESQRMDQDDQVRAEREQQTQMAVQTAAEARDFSVQAAQETAQGAMQDRQVFGSVAEQIVALSQQNAAQTAQALDQVAQGLNAVLQAIQQQSQAVIQATQQTNQAVQAVIDSVNAPKRVEFERGEDNRIVSATAEVVH